MKMLRRSPSSSPSACGLRHVPVSLRQRRRIRSVYLIRSPHTSQAETSTTPRWAWQAPSRLKTPPNGRSRPSRCCQTSKQHGNEECSSISCPVLVLGGVGLHLARLEPLVLVRCHARRPLVTDLALPRALPVSRPVLMQERGSRLVCQQRWCGSRQRAASTGQQAMGNRQRAAHLPRRRLP